ncbi:MAG TPA: hypothetical protein VII76_06050 [Acidimicrobiales bacterium]
MHVRRVLRGSCLGGLVGLSSMALAACGAPGFPTGTGTATFTWHSVQTNNVDANNPTQSPPQPFAGTVAGIPVRGTALGPVVPAGGLSALPARLTVARWTGRFQGHAFSLSVSEDTSALRDLQSATIDVDGTLGSQKVHFVVGPAGSTISNTIKFRGTVGAHHVTGSVRLFNAHGASNKASATFTVTG